MVEEKKLALKDFERALKVMAELGKEIFISEYRMKTLLWMIENPVWTPRKKISEIVGCSDGEAGVILENLANAGFLTVRGRISQNPKYLVKTEATTEIARAILRLWDGKGSDEQEVLAGG